MRQARERLDKVLVEQGLAPSRERARALIMAGLVVVGDHAVHKPGEQVQPDVQIRLKVEDHPFVSRGGLKLQKSLDEFEIDVQGMVVIDVGASTGGFTDCLLQRGARKVYAVDVGYGQLAWKLRQDERVVNLEKTNIRHLDASSMEEIPDMAVIDASFISLDKVLPNVIMLIKPFGCIVALIKPQFEVGRGEVGKGGIVREDSKHLMVIEKISLLAGDLSLYVKKIIESPIKGAKGNREFLIHLEKYA